MDRRWLLNGYQKKKKKAGSQTNPKISTQQIRPDSFSPMFSKKRVESRVGLLFAIELILFSLVRTDKSETTPSKTFLVTVIV